MFDLIIRPHGLVQLRGQLVLGHEACLGRFAEYGYRRLDLRPLEHHELEGLGLDVGQVEILQLCAICVPGLGLKVKPFWRLALHRGAIMVPDLDDVLEPVELGVLESPCHRLVPTVPPILRLDFFLDHFRILL